MKKVLKKKLEEIKTFLMANSFKKGKKWQDYTVYIPIYKKGFDAKLPSVVLEKNGEVRLSSHLEAFKYIDFARKTN
jgi:hypothetical protein